MTSAQYEILAKATTSLKQHGWVSMNFTTKQAILAHASLGISSEGGEIADCIKKHLYYNQELDTVNLKEELGDLCWYIALALNCIDSSFSEIMENNITKLKKRYPNGFTPEAAAQRIDKE